MEQNEAKIQFIKICKQDKEKLTWNYLKELVETNNLTLDDTVEILNELYKDKDDLQKFNNIIKLEYISVSTFTKTFGFGYAKAIRIIKLLLKYKAIEKVDFGYIVCDAQAFKRVGKTIFGGQNEKTN